MLSRYKSHKKADAAAACRQASKPPANPSAAVETSSSTMCSSLSSEETATADFYFRFSAHLQKMDLACFPPSPLPRKSIRKHFLWTLRAAAHPLINQDALVSSSPLPSPLCAKFYSCSCCRPSAMDNKHNPLGQPHTADDRQVQKSCDSQRWPSVLSVSCVSQQLGILGRWCSGIWSGGRKYDWRRFAVTRSWSRSAQMQTVAPGWLRPVMKLAHCSTDWQAGISEIHLLRRDRFGILPSKEGERAALWRPCCVTFEEIS